MKKRLVKKSWCFAIILFFVGASLLSSVNSDSIEKQLTEEIEIDEVKKDTSNEVKNFDRGQPLASLPIFVETLCTYDIQFFGETYVNEPVAMGNIVVVMRAVSTDSSVSPVAIVNATSRGGMHTYIANNALAVYVFVSPDMATNLNSGDNPNGGYMKGFAVLVFGRWG